MISGAEMLGRNEPGIFRENQFIFYPSCFVRDSFIKRGTPAGVNVSWQSYPVAAARLRCAREPCYGLQKENLLRRFTLAVALSVDELCQGFASQSRAFFSLG